VSGSAITQSQVVNLTTDLAGKANLAGGNAFTGAQTVTSSAIAQIPVTITGATGQTGNLFSVRSDASELAFFSAGGNLNVFNQIRAGGSTGLGQLSVTSTGSGTIGAVVRGASGQTADVFLVQNSTPNSLFRVTTGQVQSFLDMTINGVTGIGTGAASGTGQLFVLSGLSTRVGAVIRGAASQSVDLLQLQNSAGTNQFRVDQGGMTVTNSLGVAGSPSGISYAYFTTPAANAIPVVVRGAASQTADLFQIQTSAGGVSGKFDAFGYFTANNGFVLASSGGSLERAFGGAFLGMAKATSAPTNPGANIGRLYFRDGTTAGTLKLCVRAGASGAETTILDNIPQ
jgi:hypothetical protein